MRSRPLQLALLGLLACGCSRARTGAARDGGVSDGGVSDGAAVDAGAGAACASAADCANDSACVAGHCCLGASVCGGACCTGGAVCVFNRCETPGRTCASVSDCPAGQSCETGLDPAAPPMMPTMQDGGVCTSAPLLPGRCFTLPPICSVDGGAPASGCIPDCEYHPPAGKLDAVAKWRWGPQAKLYPDFTDVWSTPAVGRLYDSNCDGRIDELDSPDLVFVSGESKGPYMGQTIGEQCSATTACGDGVLRMLDGRTGQELWATAGFAGQSVAIGDLDGDGVMEIAAMLGNGPNKAHIAVVNNHGQVIGVSDQAVSDLSLTSGGGAGFGWGGALAIGDLDGDGHPEIVYGATVFSTTPAAGGTMTIKLMAQGSGGAGASQPGLDNLSTAISTLADLDGDGKLELVTGNTAYKYNPNGAGGPALDIYWQCSGASGLIYDGFPAVADLDGDGKPEVIRVANGNIAVINGQTGALGPVFDLPGTGDGGPPTIADFDGDGKPEIGVAMATYYSVVKPTFDQSGKLDGLSLLWKMPNHDMSSSVTGSTVFDFQGDGKAEVVYGDECYLWVFDGPTGAVELSTPHTSFTATESSLVADVDGDGHAEIVMVSNGADPRPDPIGWGCLDSDGDGGTVNGVTWTPPDGGTAYRGITVLGDAANSWVGTRTLWNEHSYHVSNICDDRDDACAAPDVYGSIPKQETPPWKLPWLNSFRQNVQDKGLFDAPDATVSLTVDCTSPLVLHPEVSNLGLSSLPAGVEVVAYRIDASGAMTKLASAKTTRPLAPGQSEALAITTQDDAAADTYIASIVIDPAHPLFHECLPDNDTSMPIGCMVIR